MTEIPSNATIRQEYVKCGNPDCQNQHGPYLYAYWNNFGTQDRIAGSVGRSWPQKCVQFVIEGSIEPRTGRYGKFHFTNCM